MIGKTIGESVQPHEILFDAPPVKLEVQFQIDVHFAKEDCYRLLGEISPVVETLAKRQFDDYVKRVRVLAHPRIVEQIAARPDVEQLITKAIEATS